MNTQKELDGSQANSIVLHTTDGLQILIACEDILTVSQLQKGTQIDLRGEKSFIIVQESFATVANLKLANWTIKKALLSNISDEDILPAWEPEEEKEGDEARTDWLSKDDE